MSLISQIHLLIDYFFYLKILVALGSYTLLVSPYPEGISFSRLPMDSFIQMTVKLYLQQDSFLLSSHSKRFLLNISLSSQIQQVPDALPFFTHF